MRRLLLSTFFVALACCVPPPQPKVPPTAVRTPLERQLARTVRHLSTLHVGEWPEGQSHPGERHIWQYAQLVAAAEWIEAEFRDAGYSVHREPYQVNGKTVWNIIAERRGTELAGEIFVVGAHYDTRVAMDTPRTHGPPRPWRTGTPGANDNASGVAVVLALAREFAGKPQQRTLRFAMFVNEEPPFFRTDEMGSVVHVQGCKKRGEKIVGMISAETLGYYTEFPDTQRYPFPNVLGLPTTANYVSFISNFGSRRFLHLAASKYPADAQPPLVPLAIPEVIPQIAWSDDWSFTREGMQAIAVTDTAHQRYACYHCACDTAEKLDYHKMAGVTRGLVKVVVALANKDG